MTDNRKYAIYSRKSKFTGKGESTANQVEICRNELKHRYNATDEDIVVFEDEGFSGANTKRPKFQEMMKRCRNNEFRIVICYRLDRISRNTSDFVRTYEELKDLGVSFRSVSDNIDDTSPMGKAMMMISSVFAQPHLCSHSLSVISSQNVSWTICRSSPKWDAGSAAIRQRATAASTPSAAFL